MKLAHLQATGEKYTPSWVKFKYGAWYLDPSSWKKRNVNEPLQDPKELEDTKESEAKKKSNAMVWDHAIIRALWAEYLNQQSEITV